MNGRRSRTQASTLLELAEQYELQDRRVVAEMDGEFVPRRSWGEAPLRVGATVEFVHFVGGG
nr:sulfur carrier protein ThiS [Cohnella panacarvi]